MIEISLFGCTRAEVDGRAVEDLSYKQRQILAILALHAGSPVPKHRMADLLWEGSPPASYAGTLDSYVCVLRRKLGLAAGRASELATTGAGLVFAPGPHVQVDLWRFREVTRSTGEASCRHVVAQVEQGLALVSGDLLSDIPYADWAVRARESFARELVDLCLRGAQRANAIGETGSAARMARAAIQQEPVCEDAWRQLMLAHWFSGRRMNALAAYGDLRAALSEYLGDEPSQESQQLYLTVLRDTPDLGAAASGDHRSELQALLRLLRQALDSTPGVHAPSRDSALSDAAAQVLAGVA